jgi:hypothetical protein
MTQVKQSKWRERDYDGIIALARVGFFFFFFYFHLWDNYTVPERLDFFAMTQMMNTGLLCFPPRNKEGLFTFRIVTCCFNQIFYRAFQIAGL